jgi:hypothetical protein
VVVQGWSGRESHTVEPTRAALHTRASAASTHR